MRGLRPIINDTPQTFVNGEYTIIARNDKRWYMVHGLSDTVYYVPVSGHTWGCKAVPKALTPTTTRSVFMTQTKLQVKVPKKSSCEHFYKVYRDSRYKKCYNCNHMKKDS